MLLHGWRHVHRRPFVVSDVEFTQRDQHSESVGRDLGAIHGDRHSCLLQPSNHGMHQSTACQEADEVALFPCYHPTDGLISLQALYRRRRIRRGFYVRRIQRRRRRRRLVSTGEVQFIHTCYIMLDFTPEIHKEVLAGPRDDTGKVCNSAVQW